ncbi:MAG: hypothetical protein KDI92_11485 [Xanthomonadales bacterium]|nr:hypothetical protein [Xanthomonadales bacterium]
MRQLLCLFLYLGLFSAEAVVYDETEIHRELNQTELHQSSQVYLTRYFTAKKPEQVVDELLLANLLPIQKEYILHQLLIAISQQPPQAFHQYVIDLMKTYKPVANRMADEAHTPVAIFNLRSKAHGIENIWLAYRTEQRFSQLFNKSTSEAVLAIKAVITAQSRPQWLGVKNSIAALTQSQLVELNQYLLSQVKANDGLDQLISHVGLISANEALISKALRSEQTTIREYTLRKLPQSLTQESAKNFLMQAVTKGQDSKFSVSMLHQFSDDEAVKALLINQLSNKAMADSAAFSLSQSSDVTLPERLKRRYLQSDNAIEQNHILLALKLNKSDAAKLAITDIQAQIQKNPKQNQWLKSFEGGAQ